MEHGQQINGFVRKQSRESQENSLINGYVRQESRENDLTIPLEIILICFRFYFIKMFYFATHRKLKVSDDKLTISSDSYDNRGCIKGSVRTCNQSLVFVGILMGCTRLVTVSCRV